MEISFELNGKKVTVEAPPEARLIDILRDKLGLFGTKEACGEGRCGSCNVILNGRLTLACITPMIRALGAKVVTAEGLGSEDLPNYVQRALCEADAVQCGFCTPGMAVSIYEYIENGGKNDREEIKKALSGNLCRCTGYIKIFEAVELAFKYRDEDNSNN